MSRYDVIQKELTGLRVRQAVAAGPPSWAGPRRCNPARPITRALLTLLVAAIPPLSLLLHHVWKAAFPAYRQWAARSAQLAAEIAQLRARVATIFDRYRERQG